MKKLMLTIAMMAALTVCAVTSIALADDFKTTNCKEYKNATVTRVEPDGIRSPEWPFLVQLTR